MIGPWYCTRESVKSALDEMETARSNAQIDDAIDQGARNVEGFVKRPTLAPTLATRYFDYPSRTRSPAHRVRFDEHTFISVSAVTVDNGATALAANQYFLEPANGGPPYRELQIDLGGSGALSSSDTHQRAIAVTGLAGWTDDREEVGTLATGLGASSSATATLSWTTARFGVGDVLLINSERMFIRERSHVDSGQNLGAALEQSDADTSVSVSNGAAFAIDEVITVGGERMLVVDIIGNTLVVKRGWDGSGLEAHSLGADIYAYTGVELERARLGTTLAAHLADAVVYRWRPPALLAALNRAYAINALLQQRAGFARIAGTGENAREFTGRGIAQLEKDVMRVFGRQLRTGGIV